MIDPRHELVKLAALIDWEMFEREWAEFFLSHKGRPTTELRLVAGLPCLQHAYRLSDEAVGRYAHARKVHRTHRALKQLKVYTGRVMRDLHRQLDDIPAGGLRDRIIAKFALVSQLLHQQPKAADKIYALHEPKVDCISKGSARVRYEFGCKVSKAATLDEGFVVGMRSFAGNPYDGHTLRPAL